MVNLVLSRRPGETIVIGEPPHEVVITVGAVLSQRCKLLVDAPETVPVLRGELRQERAVSDG